MAYGKSNPHVTDDVT